jgi:hypothetical protein
VTVDENRTLHFLRTFNLSISEWANSLICRQPFPYPLPDYGRIAHNSTRIRPPGKVSLNNIACSRELSPHEMILL